MATGGLYDADEVPMDADLPEAEQAESAALNPWADEQWNSNWRWWADDALQWYPYTWGEGYSNSRTPMRPMRQQMRSRMVGFTRVILAI